MTRQSDGCPYRPENAHPTVSMHHCPLCGEMVIAGMPHPNYEEFDRHLIAMNTLRRGDLVWMADGQFAIVLSPTVNEDSQKIVVFQGNGLRVLVEWTEIHGVVRLPESDAHANFAELMSSPWATA